MRLDALLAASLPLQPLRLVGGGPSLRLQTFGVCGLSAFGRKLLGCGPLGCAPFVLPAFGIDPRLLHPLLFQPTRLGPGKLEPGAQPSFLLGIEG